jgi:hypothetical protein
VSLGKFSNVKCRSGSLETLTCFVSISCHQNILFVRDHPHGHLYPSPGGVLCRGDGRTHAISHPPPISFVFEGYVYASPVWFGAPVTCVIWGLESHKFGKIKNLCDFHHAITQISREAKSHKFNSCYHTDYQISQICVIFIMSSHRFT